MRSLVLILCCLSRVVPYSHVPVNYHIQTDKGPDRYFRFQTLNGQYRKEKRFDDGSVVGAYGWVDATGQLRLYDYVADHEGYRVVRTRQMKVPIPTAHLQQPPRVNGGFGAKIKPDSISSAHKFQTKKRPTGFSSGSSQPSKKFRPLFVKKKTQKRPRPVAAAPLAPSFGSKLSSRPSSTSQPSDSEVVPPGYSINIPGGRVTIDYDTGNQYRKEKAFQDGTVIGEHGYVDPFGILRKTYYRSGSRGHHEVKKSYWVGTRSIGD